jgi:hypothetical protein
MNFTDIMENFWTWSTQGYTTTLGPYFYPLMMSGIIGYLFIKTESGLVATVATLLIVGAYTAAGIFSGVGPFSLLLQILGTLVTVGLIVLFVSRWRKR